MSTVHTAVASPGDARPPNVPIMTVIPGGGTAPTSRARIHDARRTPGPASALALSVAGDTVPDLQLLDAALVALRIIQRGTGR